MKAKIRTICGRKEAEQLLGKSAEYITIGIKYQTDSGSYSKIYNFNTPIYSEKEKAVFAKYMEKAGNFLFPKEFYQGAQVKFCKPIESGEFKTIIFDSIEPHPYENLPILLQDHERKEYMSHNTKMYTHDQRFDLGSIPASNVTTQIQNTGLTSLTHHHNYYSDSTKITASQYSNQSITNKITPTTTVKKEEIKNMNTNNLFASMNIEMGPVNGDSVVLSPFGLAFKAEANKYIAIKGEQLVEVTGMTFPSNGMIYKMPVALTKIKTGDIIVNQNRPLLVKEVSKEGFIIGIDILNAEQKTVVPLTNMFGFNFYTKVISMVNLGGANEENPFGDVNSLMMMSMMGGNSNNDMFQTMMMMKMMGGAGDFSKIFDF